MVVAFAGVLGEGARGSSNFNFVHNDFAAALHLSLAPPAIVCSVYGKSLWNLMLSSSSTFLPPSALSRRRSSCECIALICVTKATLERSINSLLIDLAVISNPQNAQLAPSNIFLRKIPAHSSHHPTRPDLPCVSSRHHHHLHSFSLSLFPPRCAQQSLFIYRHEIWLEAK